MRMIILVSSLEFICSLHRKCNISVVEAAFRNAQALLILPIEYLQCAPSFHVYFFTFFPIVSFCFLLLTRLFKYMHIGIHSIFVVVVVAFIFCKSQCLIIIDGIENMHYEKYQTNCICAIQEQNGKA